MVGIVVAIAAFDAQPPVVGGAVASFHGHDALVLDLVAQQATDPAIGADGIDRAVHGLVAHQGLGHQRPRGAGLHTFATGHAAAVAHGVAQVKDDLRVPTAVGHADHVVHLRLAAGAHTAGALDAGVQVDGDGRMAQIGRGGWGPQRRQGRTWLHAQRVGPLAELAVRLAGLPVHPFVACLGPVSQQQLQHQLLALERPFAARLHLHARLWVAAARRGQAAFARDLHHAGAAVAVGSQAVGVAEVGDLHAMALRGLQDGFAGQCLQLDAIELEGDGGRPVHERTPTSWGK